MKLSYIINKGINYCILIIRYKYTVTVTKKMESITYKLAQVNCIETVARNIFCRHNRFTIMFSNIINSTFLFFF